jgi:hypothetical protein
MFPERNEWPSTAGGPARRGAEWLHGVMRSLYLANAFVLFSSSAEPSDDHHADDDDGYEQPSLRNYRILHVLRFRAPISHNVWRKRSASASEHLSDARRGARASFSFPARIRASE